MDQSRDDLAARLEGLARELEDVRRRLDRLEARSDVAPAAGLEQAGPPAPDLALAAVPAGTLPLLGRTFIVLGGAYLLRTITDAGLIPGLAGALAGLAYAAASLGLADRAAGRGTRASAVFHGFAAVAIAYPLLWEATARLAVLTPAASAFALLAFLGLGLVVAWRRGLGEVASASVLFAVLTALGLLVRTHDLVAFTVVLLLVAAAVEGCAFWERWPGLRWPVAIAVDLAIVLVATVELREGGPPEEYPVLSPMTLVAIGLGLALVYLAGTCARTLLRGRPVTPFESTQTPTALLLGYGGATSVVAASGGNATLLGALGLLLGAGGYAAAFSFLERRPEFGRNFYAYTTLGGALTLAGTWMILPAAPLAMAWSALGLAAAWLGARFERMTLKVHGSLYLAAAAAMGGLIGHASDGLLGEATASWRVLRPAGAVVFLLVVASYGVLARARESETASWRRRLPAVLLAVLLVWSAAGLAVAGLGGILDKAPGPAADAAVLAAVRTAVLAGLAVALAWTGRRWARRELTWLVYPLLGAGALKLLLEDLPAGRPATLFISFALYGAALIAIPRLTRSE